MLLLLVACSESRSIPCGERFCPEDLVCRVDVCTRCGNGVVDDQEECDEGERNADTPDAPCRRSCQLPSCGDGVVDKGAGEECDLGENNSAVVTGVCRPSCKNPSCGDGVVDPGEEIGCLESPRPIGRVGSLDLALGASLDARHDALDLVGLEDGEITVWMSDDTGDYAPVSMPLSEPAFDVMVAKELFAAAPYTPDLVVRTSNQLLLLATGLDGVFDLLSSQPLDDPSALVLVADVAGDGFDDVIVVGDGYLRCHVRSGDQLGAGIERSFSGTPRAAVRLRGENFTHDLVVVDDVNDQLLYFRANDQDCLAAPQVLAVPGYTSPPGRDVLTAGSLFPASFGSDDDDGDRVAGIVGDHLQLWKRAPGGSELEIAETLDEAGSPVRVAMGFAQSDFGNVVALASADSVGILVVDNTTPRTSPRATLDFATTFLQMEDFDGDDFPDVLLGDGERVYLARGGDGLFGRSLTIEKNFFSIPVVAHDFDGDGLDEVISRLDGELEVRTISAGRVLGEPIADFWAFLSPGAELPMRRADLNGDGIGELVLGENGDLVVLEPVGRLEPGRETLRVPLLSPREIVVGHVDDDAIDDLIVVGAARTVLVHGSPDGTLAAGRELVTAPLAHGVIVDRKLVYTGLDGGLRALDVASGVEVEIASGRFATLVPATLRRDGTRGVVVCEPAGLRAYLHEGGSFSEIARLVGSDLCGLLASDFNRDGLTDLITYGGNDLRTYLGLGDGRFQLSANDLPLVAVILGHFNRDGREDYFYNDDGNKAGLRLTRPPSP